MSFFAAIWFIPEGVLPKKILNIFDLRPYAIIERFGLKNPIFQRTASYGHFGRTNYTEEVEVSYTVEKSGAIKTNGKKTRKKVEFFAWEKLDYVAKIKKEFGLK